MTISYEDSMLTLFFKWKASVWKVVWKELFVYLVLYYIVRLTYYEFLPRIDPSETNHMKKTFEKLVPMFSSYSEKIPITFILGFYVSQIVSRWWTQFQLISWPEDLLSAVYMLIYEKDEKNMKLKHQITRYINASNVLAWRDISTQIRLRYPSVHTFVTNGLLTENELQILEEDGCISGARWMVPLQWVNQMVSDYLEINTRRIPLATVFLNELNKARSATRNLYCHDWVPIPLVYTHIAALATYSYFAFALIGRQFLDVPGSLEGDPVDLRIPIFTIVQFITYVGWLKVGLDLLRPFGDDDDDIELAYILDRNLTSSFAFTDNVHRKTYPPFEEDIFWKHNFDNKNGSLRGKLLGDPPRLHAYVAVGGGKKIFNKEVQKKRFITW